MNEDKFWEIMALLDWTENQAKNIVAPAINALSACLLADIDIFHDILNEKLFLLDTPLHAQNAYEKGLESLHTDGFLEIRCAVVANGRKFYEEVLKDAQKMPKELYFVHIFNIPHRAYQLKTNQKYEHRSKYSAITYANREAWKTVLENLA